MRDKRLPLVGLTAMFAAAAAVLVACAKDAPPPTVPVGGGDAAADAADAAPAWAAMGTPGDAGAPAADASATAPVAVDMSAALDTAIDAVLKAAAAKDAPGATPEGQPGRATLAAGERFNMIVTLQPNRCYTIIGASAPGQVTDLELKLMAPPLYNIEAGKSGPSDKATPIIGKGKAALCPILPVPVPYRVDAVATKGAGRVGIQVFGRTK